MMKSVGAVLAGVFIGAAATEILRRKYPDALGKLYDSIRETAATAKDAFKKGYENTAQTSEAIEPAV